MLFENADKCEDIEMSEHIILLMSKRASKPHRRRFDSIVWKYGEPWAYTVNNMLGWYVYCNYTMMMNDDGDVKV